MNHFENNRYSGIDLSDAIGELTDFTGIACTNAVMVAGGEVEGPTEKDAACMWAIIGLCEAVLDGMPQDVREKGFVTANENINTEVRDLIEKRRAEKAEQTLKKVIALVFGKED